MFYLQLGGKVHMTVVYVIKQINVNDLFRMHICLESIFCFRANSVVTNALLLQNLMVQTITTMQHLSIVFGFLL